MSAPQRIYLYLASYVSFAVTLTGAYLLAVEIGYWQGEFITGAQEDVAVALAMLIVGLPVWLGHDVLARRAMRHHPDEAGSVLRKLYVHGALATALLYVFAGAQRAVVDILAQLANESIVSFERVTTQGPALAALIAAVLWLLLWLRELREGQPTARARTVLRWRAYATSAVFLLLSAAGIYVIFHAVAGAVYDYAFGGADTIFIATDDLQEDVRDAAGATIIGIIVWGLQWRAIANRDHESILRRVYLYGLFVVGALSLLGGAAGIVYFGVSRLVGADETPSTVEYGRQFIRPALALLIGLVLLAYHWSVIHRDTGRRPAAAPTALSATFRYVMAAAGLAALVPGLVGLLGYVLTASSVDDILTRPRGEDAEFLAAALTAVIIGGPLWFVFWLRTVGADPRNLVRRLYLYAALLVLGAIWLFSLIGLIATVLMEPLDDIRSFSEPDETILVLLSAIIPSLFFFAYHVLVLRGDARRAAAMPPPITPEPAEEPPPVPAFFVAGTPATGLVVAAPMSIVHSVAERLRESGHTDVREVPLAGETDPDQAERGAEVADEALARLTDALADEEGGALVLMDRGELRVYPAAQADEPPADDMPESGEEPPIDDEDEASMDDMSESDGEPPAGDSDEMPGDDEASMSDMPQPDREPPVGDAGEMPGGEMPEPDGEPPVGGENGMSAEGMPQSDGEPPVDSEDEQRT